MPFHEALAALKSNADALAPLRTRDLFARDPGRVREFSVELNGLLFDFSTTPPGLTTHQNSI